jgi:hypothetical protein
LGRDGRRRDGWASLFVIGDAVSDSGTRDEGGIGCWVLVLVRLWYDSDSYPMSPRRHAPTSTRHRSSER